MHVMYACNVCMCDFTYVGIYLYIDMYIYIYIYIYIYMYLCILCVCMFKSTLDSQEIVVAHRERETLN